MKPQNKRLTQGTRRPGLGHPPQPCPQGHEHGAANLVSRRAFLKSTASAMALGPTAAALRIHTQTTPGGASKGRETYDTHAKGIRILPGQWRPHYPWEHIVWISPAWPGQDYIWLDFPEALFTSQGLLYLSHINPGVPALYATWPPVPWRTLPNGVSMERELPNGVRLGGTVSRSNDTTVALELRLHNGSSAPLNHISLQTCAFLRGIREFADYTRENKFVHVPAAGWISLSQALALKAGTSPYRVGWRTSGKPVADWPVLVTRSSLAERWLGMTWRQDTLSLVGNPNHPCMHADPKFKDLAPGDSAAIHGRLFFFEGSLAEFDFASVIA
jgi:hypothetical protein